MKLTKADHRVEADYHRAEPKQFGDLHQRMQYVMHLAQKIKLYAIDNNLWQAIWDLQTEVAHHVPAHPPYGRRSVAIGSARRSQ